MPTRQKTVTLIIALRNEKGSYNEPAQLTDPFTIIALRIEKRSYYNTV